MTKVHFILAEDRAQSRFIKRQLAESGAWLHLVVGTWLELAETLQGVFLAGTGEDHWGQRLSQAAAGMEEAFWAASLKVAPAETLACLDAELRRLLRAAGPGQMLADRRPEGLGARGSRHFLELCALHRAMEGILPAELDLVQRLLAVEPATRLKDVAVYPGLLRSVPDPWQQALLQWLNGLAGSQADAERLALLAGLGADEGRAGGRALGHLAARLFTTGCHRVPLDDSVQWLAVRDPLQEVEVAAGIIQQALRDDRSLIPGDFALLVPDDDSYALPLQAVFGRAGIPLSGFDGRLAERDLGAEVWFYFLLSLHKPAPVMALAAFLTSPLLPWEGAAGHHLAQRVMDGRFDFPPPEGASDVQRQLLQLLREGTEDGGALRRALQGLAKCLSRPEPGEPHRRRAVELGESLMAMLPPAGAIPWEALLQACVPVPRRADAPLPLYREGVAVFSEGEEPWRRVRQLLILGFCQGRYPAGVGGSPVFGEADLAALRDSCGLAVELPADLITRRRQRLRRQLAAASERAHFLIPRRSECGEPVPEAGSLTFMARLFEGVEEASGLVRELERRDDLFACRGLALAQERAHDPGRALTIADLDFQRNLLRVKTRADGSLRPLSPSSLATLMVSPLAWLLSRLGLEGKEWCPEALDVATKGTLAHRVFEDLFSPGQPIPTEAEIGTRVPTLLQKAVRDLAPFLLAAAWRVERAHLQREIQCAATSWSAFLGSSGGQVLGNELWLDGRLDDLPLHGSADSVVGLPDGRIFVVDFKKSKSAKRREQMEQGYDSQASLYRLMLQTGEAQNRDDELGRALRQGHEIGILYYLMNDQVALTDTAGWLKGDLPGAFELGAGISTAAMALIRERIGQIRRGEVRLNGQGDEEWYQKNAGITIYALDNSPLLRLFMHPREAQP